MTSTAQQRWQDRRRRAEVLLRAGEYTAAQLAAALRYGLAHTRTLLSDLLGRDRTERCIFISSWAVSRGSVRITRIPRYRWRTGYEMDATQPTLDECRALLAGPADASLSPPPAALARDPLLGALFAHRVKVLASSAPDAGRQRSARFSYTT